MKELLNIIKRQIANSYYFLFWIIYLVEEGSRKGTFFYLLIYCTATFNAVSSRVRFKYRYYIISRANSSKRFCVR